MIDFPPFPVPSGPPVIIGAGNAGLAAAARLSARGIHSILLEKQSELGGQLWLSGGAFSAAGTRRQRQHAIHDTAEQHYEEVMRISHHKATPYLVQMATRYAATAVDWIDDLGFPFAPGTPEIVLGHEPYSVPRTYWGHHDINGARALLETLEPAIDNSIIDVRTSHKLLELVFDSKDGELCVSGVTAEGPSGEIFIETNTVILATGGYAAARDLLDQLQPGRSGALLGCLPHATGDAHRILSKLGVRLVGGDTYLPTMGMIESPETPGTALKLSEARVIVDANSRMPWEIWVNTRGERWIDETVTSPDVRERALLQQPDLIWWSIWNEEVLNAAPTTPIGPDWSIEKLRKISRKQSWLVQAETIEDLAQQLRVPVEKLRATLNSYNSSAPDPLGRTFRPCKISSGPYYAVRSVGAMLLSRGGPEVDEALQPVTSDGITLHGVHAIGELLGMSQFSGDAFAGGMSVGPALTFGVLVADRIAEAASRISK